MAWTNPPVGAGWRPWVEARLVEHEGLIFEHDGELTKLDESAADQGMTTAALKVSLDEIKAAVEEIRAKLAEGDTPPDEPPDEPPVEPLPVPILTHVNNMTPQEVHRDMDAWGANGVFLYRPLDDNRLRNHLDYFRAAGRDCWYQNAPGGWSEASVRAVLDYATTDECRRMVWCQGQEMQHKLQPSQYAEHLRQQSALFDLVHSYGCLTGVHGESWLVHPTNTSPLAGAANFRTLLGDLSKLDVLALSIMDWNQKDSGKAQLQYVLDALPAGFDKPIWVSSMCWTVPQAEPQGSARRQARKTAVFNALDAFDDSGVVGYGWFNVSPWDRGTGPLECSVAADPLLLGTLAPFARSRVS
jgi:hypothetical protein